MKNTGGFFSTNNNNLLSGADTVFGLTGLSKAFTAFRKIKRGPGSREKDKRNINVAPKFLLVPVELEIDAERFIGSSHILLDGAASETQIGSVNPHQNKYKVLAAPQLSDSYYTGYSNAAWYMFADPQKLAAFELVFLKGKQTPTIQRVPTAPNVLGISYIGYIDVGCNYQDNTGAVKSNGS